VALFTARRGFLDGAEARWIDDQRRLLAEIELHISVGWITTTAPSVDPQEDPSEHPETHRDVVVESVRLLLT
jgi:hypothetical protein